MLEYRNINKKFKRFHSKGFIPVFVIKKNKNAVPWTYVISDFNEEEIVGMFYEKELQKSWREKFKRKDDKLYVNPNLVGLFRVSF